MFTSRRDFKSIAHRIWTEKNSVDDKSEKKPSVCRLFERNCKHLREQTGYNFEMHEYFINLWRFTMKVIFSSLVFFDDKKKKVVFTQHIMITILFSFVFCIFE